MRLSNAKRHVSPDTAGYVRATGLIAFDDGEEFDLWVDVPEDCAEALSDTGNPWLVAMLPIAASRGEAIQMSLAVDALLLENIRGILAIWREWYPELHDVRIDCPTLPYQDRKPGKTAAFFSGGIDSYFTVARRMPGNPYGIPAVGKLDDLITVWGFDVGVHDEAQFKPLEELTARSATALELGHAVIRTNLRQAERRFPFKDAWRRLSHGAGLAFIGLSLEKAYREVIIGSTYTYGHLFPWGSHPLLDPLFSTTQLVFNHDGAACTRIAKTDLVARLAPVREMLHVCFSQGHSNCSCCDKCFRTMIAIDLLGHRDKFTQAFDWSKYSLQSIGKLPIYSAGDKLFRDEQVALAKERGRTDVLKALGKASRRSRMLHPFIHFSEFLMNLPLVWRAGILLKKFLMKGPVRKI